MAQDISVLEKRLWESADNLRANSKLTSSQYCMPVMGLIFLRYAYGRFLRVKALLEKESPFEPTREDYLAKGALYLPAEAHYKALIELPASANLGQKLNEAMVALERESAQLEGVLPRGYEAFPPQLLRELVHIFDDKVLDTIGGDVFGRIYEYFLRQFAPVTASDDGVFFTPKCLVKLIVNILEPKGGTILDPACGSGGMFVQSGDFIGDSANLKATFYGQEKVEYNAKLCLMNMAVHGLNAKIQSGESANSFYHDAHALEGKCDYVLANPPFNVDAVAAEAAIKAGRLPFGLPKINKENHFSNGNYLWISYFYAYLNEKGRAGFVMPASATDSDSKGEDRNIRENLVKSGHLDLIVSVGTNFFYTKTLPCALWFFDKGKPKALQDKVLFLDARNIYTKVPDSRTLREWTLWQTANLTAIVQLYRGNTEAYHALLKSYREALNLQGNTFAEALKHETETLAQLQAESAKALKDKRGAEKTKLKQAWDAKETAQKERVETATQAVWLYEKFGEGAYADIPGLCKVATREEIAKKNYTLNPGVYVGIEAVQQEDPANFKARMAEIHSELKDLFEQSRILEQRILQNLSAFDTVKSDGDGQGLE